MQYGPAPIEIFQVEWDKMSITATFPFSSAKTLDGKLLVARLPNGLFRSDVGPSEMKRYEYLIHPIRFVEARLASSSTLKLVEIKHDVSAKGENLDPNAKMRR